MPDIVWQIGIYRKIFSKGVSCKSANVLYDRFTLNFEEAKKYRKAFGNFIRAVQWKDLIVEVYIRQD